MSALIHVLFLLLSFIFTHTHTHTPLLTHTHTHLLTHTHTSLTHIYSHTSSSFDSSAFANL